MSAVEHSSIRRSDFPDDFLWGVATAAAQIEGGALEDGRSDSIWDAYSRVPERILDGSTPVVTCDHYHRWREDLDLLSELGVNAYRFSVSWSRIMPAGKGAVAPAGAAFYDRLIDELLARGITPMVTIWHADQPQILEDAGGWPCRDMAHWFAEYAEALFRRYGDRVRHWITLNEPNCFLYMGYGSGQIAPGTADFRQAYQAIHHALLGHGEAVRRFREGGYAGEIGVTMSVDRWVPASDDPADIAAAAQADEQNNWWLLDPLFLGRYPDAHRAHIGDMAPVVAEGDLASIATPIDFFGLNYYGRNIVKAGREYLGYAAKSDYGTVGNEIDPAGMVEVMRTMKSRYGALPIYITENGYYGDQQPQLVEGVYADPGRVQFLHDHLVALRQALNEGIDVRGYCWWTLMDNWEWTAGFGPRMGLYYTDFTTRTRSPKLSAQWYQTFLRKEIMS